MREAKQKASNFCPTQANLELSDAGADPTDESSLLFLLGPQRGLCEERRRRHRLRRCRGCLCAAHPGTGPVQPPQPRRCHELPAPGDAGAEEEAQCSGLYRHGESRRPPGTEPCEQEGEGEEEGGGELENWK
eukprot:765013-Hanusia_phi.AAC.1